MEKIDYHAIDVRFKNVFNRYAGELSEDGRENIEHFIDVAEWEMACESFVLTVLEEKVQLTEDAKKELLDLALALRLDKESIFCADFWQIVNPLFNGNRSR